jgi:hypothetical protein
MAKIIVTRIVVLFLATGTAQTAELCGVVLKTLDGFLALREGPGIQNKMIAKLFEGNTLYTKDDTTVFGDEAPYQCLNPVREYGLSDNKRRCQNLWVRVSTDEQTHSKIGWVNRKYVRQFPCKNPEHIDKASDIQEEILSKEPEVDINPDKEQTVMPDEMLEDWCKRNDPNLTAQSCIELKSETHIKRGCYPKWTGLKRC